MDSLKVYSTQVIKIKDNNEYTEKSGNVITTQIGGISTGQACCLVGLIAACFVCCCCDKNDDN